MIPPVIVTIYGNVSVGKSQFARKIEKLAIKLGMSVIVCDHKLFSFDNNFVANLQKARATIETKKPDFGIIVVGTGLDETPPFKIEIDHQGFGAVPFFELLFCDEVE